MISSLINWVADQQNDWVTGWLKPAAEWLANSGRRGVTAGVWEERAEEDIWIQKEEKKEEVGRKLYSNSVFLSFHPVF